MYDISSILCQKYECLLFFIPLAYGDNPKGTQWEKVMVVVIDNFYILSLVWKIEILPPNTEITMYWFKKIFQKFNLLNLS